MTATRSQLEHPICFVDGINPRLASWDAAHHPSQQAMQRYLADIATRAGELPEDGLWLHLDVVLDDARKLLMNYDLENYLTPVVNHLGARRFASVTGSKRVGGGSSSLVIRRAFGGAGTHDGWERFSLDLGSNASRQKHALRADLVKWGCSVLPAGGVEVAVHIRCSSRRNWVNLWKHTIDAMGPILGEPNASPYNPADGRIVRLGFHRSDDDTLGHDVHVDLAWRPAPPP